MLDPTNLDKTAQKILAATVGSGMLIVLFSLSYLVVKASKFQYSRGETTISIDRAKQVKAQSNDIEYANKKLLEKLNLLETNIATLQNYYQDDPTVEPILDYVDESVKNLEPVAKEIDKSTEQLKQTTKEVIEESEDKIKEGSDRSS